MHETSKSHAGHLTEVGDLILFYLMLEPLKGVGFHQVVNVVLRVVEDVTRGDMRVGIHDDALAQMLADLIFHAIVDVDLKGRRYF